MSVLREIKVDVDLETMEKTAREKGWAVSKNRPVVGYGGRYMPNSDSDLVIRETNVQYEIGFKSTKEGVKKFTDDWMGIAERSYATIFPHYVSRLVTTKAESAGFQVSEIVEDADQILVKLRR